MHAYEILLAFRAIRRYLCHPQPMGTGSELLLRNDIGHQKDWQSALCDAELRIDGHTLMRELANPIGDESCVTSGRREIGTNHAPARLGP
jgi:hypothetical protein